MSALVNALAWMAVVMAAFMMALGAIGTILGGLGWLWLKLTAPRPRHRGDWP